MKPDETLRVNRKICYDFVRSARSFLNLPKSLMEADRDRRNPSLYAGKLGKKAITRSKKGLTILRKANKELAKLEKLLRP